MAVDFEGLIRAAGAPSILGRAKLREGVWLTPDTPRIIVFPTDRHCGYAMSHVGDADLETSAMDRLAAEGIRFQITTS